MADKVEELAERLVGTCVTCLVAEELETKEQLEQFDGLAFQCDQCGWWCAAEELHNEHGQSLCDECNEEEHGDGDYDAR